MIDAFVFSQLAASALANLLGHMTDFKVFPSATCVVISVLLSCKSYDDCVGIITLVRYIK